MKHLNWSKNVTPFFFCTLMVMAATLPACKQQETATNNVKQMDTANTKQMAASIEALVKPELADSSLSLRLWGIDSLVISPIAIDIDDMGRLYYTTTNRQKNSEFDIRAHPDWEIPSIQLQTVEDKTSIFTQRIITGKQ